MNEHPHPPIKRHAALAPLSRDHYVGLVHAHRLMKAAQKGRVARHKALADFIDAWTTEIAPHFQDEERLLLPLISLAEDRRRLLEEHASIERAVEHARTLRKSVDPDPASVSDMGRLLEGHIRWEERVLFNRVQDGASSEQLSGLQECTSQVERSRSRSGSRSGPPTRTSTGGSPAGGNA